MLSPIDEGFPLLLTPDQEHRLGGMVMHLFCDIWVNKSKRN
jgi:hypothetical protein